MPAINDFWNGRRYLYFGYSRNSKSMGRQIFAKLTEAGLELLPVRKDVSEIDGMKMFSRFEEIDGDIDGAFIAVSPPSALEILADLKSADIRRVFFQIGASDPNVIEKCQELDIEYETGCALMRFDGMGFPHSFHKWISNTFSGKKASK